MPSSSELSLLVQQLDELSGNSSRRGRGGAKAVRIGEVNKGQPENEAEIRSGRKVRTTRQIKCASLLGGSGSEGSSRRTTSGGSSRGPRNDASSHISSNEQPKWTAESLLQFFSNSRSRDEKKPPSPAAERENGSADISFASADDLHLVRQAAAAAAKRCFSGASRSLSPCLAPYYSPVLHPFWIAQPQEKTVDAMEKDNEVDTDDNDSEGDHMNSFSELASTVSDLLAADDIASAGAIRATRLRGRSSSRRHKFPSTHRAAARSRRLCKTQRELLQQELPQQSPEAAAAAAAALLSCNSFNSYRIATVVPPAPGRGTWSGETNLGDLLPVLLPEQYEIQKEEHQQLQQMLLPLHQEQKPLTQTPIHNLMHQEHRGSLLPQEIYDLSALPAAAEPKAAGAAAAVGKGEENGKPLQLPLTTEQLVEILKGNLVVAPGEAGNTLYGNLSSSSLPGDLTFVKNVEEQAALRRQASADVRERRMGSRRDALSRAFVSASFAAAVATAEAEAERVAAQPVGKTVQQPHLKVRFERQHLVDGEAQLGELPTARSSLRLLPDAAHIREEAPVPVFAHEDNNPGAPRDPATGTESEDTEEFPYTSRTPVAATLAAEAAAADAAAAAKREAASLSAACDVVGRIKLQQVWGAAAAEQQKTRLLDELEHKQNQQKFIEAEVKAIDGLQQELDTWQADLKQHQQSLLQPARQQHRVEQHRQQQLTRQQKISDSKLQQHPHVQGHQNPPVELYRELLENQHAELPGNPPDMSLASPGAIYFAEKRKLFKQEAETLRPLVQECSQEQQKESMVIVLEHNNTVSPAVATTCSAAAVTASAAGAADSMSPNVFPAAVSPPPATTAKHHARGSADVLSVSAPGIQHYSITTAGDSSARTAAPAFTAASPTLAAGGAAMSAIVSSGTPAQLRSLSRPPQPLCDTVESPSTAAKLKRSTSTAAGDAVASSGNMSQVRGAGRTRGAAASDISMVSPLQSGSGQINIISCSKQQQLQQQQQPEKKQQQKELQQHCEPGERHEKSPELPTTIQQQMGSTKLKNVSLTIPTSAVRTEAYTVAAAGAGPAAADDRFSRDGKDPANADGALAECTSTLRVNGAGETAAFSDASGVPLVPVPAITSPATSSSSAACARAADGALTQPPPMVPASEHAAAVGLTSVSAINGTSSSTAADRTAVPAVLPPAPSVKLPAKSPHYQQMYAEEKLRFQQREKEHPRELQRLQQVLSQQQLQPLTSHTSHLHRKVNQQYVSHQQPAQHPQQTPKMTVYFPGNVKPGALQTAAHAMTQRSMQANRSVCTLPSGGGRADTSGATTGTVAPPNYTGHPTGATVVRKWRIVDGIPIPIMQTLAPAFTGTGPAAVVGTSPSSAAAARNAPSLLAKPVALKSAAATTVKPRPEKKLSLFEKLRLLLSGGSSSSCTECVCDTLAASTTRRLEKDRQQQPRTATRAMSAVPAPPLPLWLPQDKQRQRVLMPWQLPHQQHVQQQQQLQQHFSKNGMLPQQSIKGEKRHSYTTAPSITRVVAGTDPTCPMPLSYPSILFPSSKVPPRHDLVELHVTQPNSPQKRAEEEVQQHTIPIKSAFEDEMRRQQQEDRRMIPAPSYTHADAPAKGPLTGYAAETPPSASFVTPICIPPVVSTSVTKPLQNPPSRQAGLESGTPHSIAVVSPIVPFGPCATQSVSAITCQDSGASIIPTATAGSATALAASAAPCTVGGVYACHTETEQPQQRYLRRSEDAVPIAAHHAIKPDSSYYPPVILSASGRKYFKERLPLQEVDDGNVQLDWERQQQYAFQQQLQQFRRQQGIYSKSGINEQQRCEHEDIQLETIPNSMATSFSLANEQGNQAYRLPTVTRSNFATACGSSTFPHVAINESEAERHLQGRGRQPKTAKSFSRGGARRETFECPWSNADAGKKTKSKVPKNWIRFGTDATTTEGEAGAAAAAAPAAGHTGAIPQSKEAWVLRSRRRQRRCPDDVKERWLQEHPEHQPAVAFDNEYLEQQPEQELQVTEDPPQTGASGHTERVQQLLQQRRLLQQQRQRLLKQERQRSTRNLEAAPVPPAELSSSHSNGVHAMQQRRSSEDVVPQRQIRCQQLGQQEGARSLRQKQRLPREQLRRREDSAAKVQQSDGLEKNKCVYLVATTAGTLDSPHAAADTHRKKEEAATTVSKECGSPMSNAKATSSPHENMCRKSGSRRSRPKAEELLILEQGQLVGVDSTGSSSARLVAGMPSEEAESGATMPSREASAEVAADAGPDGDEQTTPSPKVGKDAKVDDAGKILVQRETTLDRSNDAGQRRQERTREANDSAAAAAAAHIAAIAATKAAKAADTAIAVLAAATGGTPLNVLASQPHHQQQRHLLDRCAGTANARTFTALHQFPGRYTRNEKVEPEEIRTSEVEGSGHASAILTRTTEAAVDGSGSGGAQAPGRNITLRRQSHKSKSASPAVAAQVPSVGHSTLLAEEEMVKCERGVGNPKAAAAATAAASAAAAEAAREAARRAAANIQEVAAVVSDPLQPLQQLFSFCTGGSNLTSQGAATDKPELRAVANSTYESEIHYSYERSPWLQQPVAMRYRYITPPKSSQPEGDDQQQVHCYCYGASAVRPGEPSPVRCRRREDAALEAPALCERIPPSTTADTPCWRTTSLASTTPRRN